MSKINTKRSRRRGGGARSGVFPIRPEGRVDDGADLRRSGAPGEEQILFLVAQLRGSHRGSAQEIVRRAAEDLAEAEDGGNVRIRLSPLIPRDGHGRAVEQTGEIRLFHTLR